MDKQQHIDQLFAQAKQGPVMQSFEQTKDRFKASVNTPTVNNSKTKQVFTKKWIIMLTTVSTISISLFLLLNSGKPNKTTPQTQKTKTNQVVSQNTSIPNQPKTESKQKQPVIRNTAPFLASIQELVTELPLAQESIGTEAAPGNERTFQSVPPRFLDDPYQFPVLTEEEIAITKKKKKAMLKALIKHDKDSYAYIPSGSFDYNGKQVSAQAFYMGTGEVTNFEYRTFLFDLIIQGRKDEFMKAKPDQTQWTKAFNHEGKPAENAGKGFQEHYFSHKAFNEFPVVNISREGAELYCLWLSQEVRKSVGDEKEGKYNDVRLPIRAEWVKAASQEGKMLPYPWGGPYTRNSKGFILANYLRETKDEILESTNGTQVGDVLAPSKSYWPNEYGIYNLSGNAAEMVYEGMDKTEPGTAGGSWKNNKEEIKIYAPDPNKGVIDAKPTIGFRVVSTYLIVYKK